MQKPFKSSDLIALMRKQISSLRNGTAGADSQHLGFFPKLNDKT
jgi:hypothetical protein